MQKSDTFEWQRDAFVISTDPARLDLTVIYEFLHTSYWARGIPRDIVEAAVANSLMFGLYHNDQQIGGARVVTDYATFAYLADVFVLDAFRGQGLGKWLIEVVISHPQLQGLRRWMLMTADAHGLYQQFGFTPLARPDRAMELWFPDMYSNNL